MSGTILAATVGPSPRARAIAAVPLPPLVFRLITLLPEDDRLSLSWRVPVCWSVPIAAIVVGEFARGLDGNGALRLLLLACAWFGVVAPWLVWRRLVGDWARIASGFVDGGLWFSERLDRLARVRTFLLLSAASALFVGVAAWSTLLQLAAVHDARISILDVLTLAAIVLALGPAAVMTFESLRTLTLVSLKPPSDFVLAPGEELDSPGIQAMVELVRYEAILGAVLFLLVSLPVTVTVWSASPRARVIWAIVLIVPLAAVLFAGLVLPRSLFRPAHRQIRDVSATMRRRLHELWMAADAGIDAEVLTERRDDAILGNAQAVATTLLAYTTSQSLRSRSAGDLSVSLASAPLALQALALVLGV
jgi:hypothetical protein